MALTINTNIASIQSERALAANRGNLEKAMQRLSSGKRINTAVDDASGMAVANRMTNEISGLNMAIRNANDGISMAQTAEGAMEELQNILSRMRELAVQSSNGTYTAEDRSYIAAEFDELTKEIRRVSTQATWDGNVPLISEAAKPMQVQVGINAADYIQVPLQSLTVEDLNIAKMNNVKSSYGARIDDLTFTGTTSLSTSYDPVGSDASTCKDVKFGCSPLPNFELHLWNGNRDSAGKPDGLAESTNVLTATGAKSVNDLIAQLKASPNYDATTCDLQFSEGKLQVIWKIAGVPAPLTDIEVTNQGSGVTIAPTQGAAGDYYTSATTHSASYTAAVTGDETDYPAHYSQQFDISNLVFYRDTLPKSEGNHFSMQIGGRTLTADNVTDITDLVSKLHQDSDYNFVREAVGLGDSKLDLFSVIDTPATSSAARVQKLSVNFGVAATDRAFLRQSVNNVTISNPESAVTALDYVDQAAKVVNESRARMGATMSRIEYTVNNLMNVVQNTEEAKSRVLDTDYAKESAELAKAQILNQAGTAMLAQANQSQQYVLNLLKP